jgi:hypothetical protein
MKLSRLPLLLLLAAACSDERGDDGTMIPKGDAGTGDTGTPDSGVNLGFEVQAVAGELAAAECGYLSRCVPEYYDATQTDQAACVAETTDAIVAAYESLAPLIDAGRMRFDEAQKDACLQAIQNADCIEGLSAGSPCDRYLVGTQEMNEPCFLADECAPNLYCNRAQGLGTCGACAQTPMSGAACDAFTPCSEGTECLQVQQGMFRCIGTTALDGEQCGTVETGLCQGSLNCVGDQTAMCVPPGESGDQCDNDPQTFALPECSIETGYACDGAMCTTLNWSDLNGTCNATTFCREGYCNNGTCTALPAAGESCQQVGACGQDAFCDGTNCRPLIADGQACNFSAECSGELFCLGAGVNRPGSCGLLEWQLCQ